MKTLLLIISGLLVLSPMWVINFLPAFKNANYDGQKKLLALSAIPVVAGLGIGFAALKFFH